jgi:dienelactone hydrolase
MIRRRTMTLLEKISLVALFGLMSAKTGVPAELDRYNLARSLKPLTSRPPQIHPVPAQDKAEIKALFFDGLAYQGKPTRIFAYLGIPADPGRKLPGMVLVHGGGGTAFPEWVRIWNERGYAAIAMDLEGGAPITNAWAGPARVGVFNDARLPLTNQWMYHAVADIMLAHSLLAAQPGVDAKKIGVTGVSWGGVLSSLVAGVDERFKFAAPVYGCGFLYDSAGFFGKSLRQSTGAEFAARTMWDPARYFSTTRIPMLWVNGDQDAHFSVDITSRSHAAVKRNSFLSIHPAMPHSHPPGWQPKSVPEIYAFADHILKRGEPLPKITRQPTGTNIVVKYSSPRPITNASIWFVDGPIVYQSPESMKSAFTWHRLDGAVDRKTRTVTATLPAEAKSYYVNITDDRGLTASANLTFVGR